MNPSTPIRVCHIASGDLWAGAEAQIALTVAALNRDSAIRVSAIVLNSGRLYEELRSTGVPVLLLPEGGKGVLELAKAAADFVARHEVKILHSHRYKENVLAWMVRRHYHAPVLVRTQHGMPEPVWGFKAARQRLIQGVDRFLARHAFSAVICVSYDLGQRMQRYVSAEKISVIPNAIAPADTVSTLDPATAKQRLGILPSQTVIGIIGRLVPVKRVDLFLEAAALVNCKLAGLRFVVVGDGPQRGELESRARELGLNPLFLGHRDDVLDVLRAFDLLVISSDHEGLPTVLLEAMESRVPVVARAVGGIPEVIADNVTGFLVSGDTPQALADRCRAVLQAPIQERQRVVKNAAVLCEKYYTSNTAPQIVAVYRKVLAQRGAETLHVP